MFKIDSNYNMYLNRGDQCIIRLTNKDGVFTAGDTLVFSVMKKGNAGEIIFQKFFEINEECQTYDIVLTPEETRIGNIIKSGNVTY